MRPSRAWRGMGVIPGACLWCLAAWAWPPWVALMAWSPAAPRLCRNRHVPWCGFVGVVSRCRVDGGGVLLGWGKPPSERLFQVLVAESLDRVGSVFDAHVA